MTETFSLIVSCILFHRESIGKSIGDSFWGTWETLGLANRLSMEESLHEEVLKLIDELKLKMDGPIVMNKFLNIAVFNALWYIMASEKLEFGNPKVAEVLHNLDILVR